MSVVGLALAGRRTFPSAVLYIIGAAAMSNAASLTSSGTLFYQAFLVRVLNALPVLAVSSPRLLMLALTLLVRSKLAFLKMTPKSRDDCR